MTSKNYDAAAVCEGTVKPPAFGLAIGGAAVQLAGLYALWGVPDPSTAFGAAYVTTVVLSACVWVLSIVKGGRSTPDPSIVDRLWSITPWLYCWWFYYCCPADSPGRARLALMAVITTLWGVRLSWNFWRKGGYSGHEDYRWVEVRKWFPGLKFEFFNLVFVCFFQLHLVFAQALPSALALELHRAPLNALDAVAAALYLALVLLEHVADLQMFAFQTEKYRRKGAGEDLGPHYGRGFLTTGTYAYSRHPNYFAEVTMWWAFYLFGVAAGGDALNWTLAGAVMLALLFVPPGASLDTTEALSSRKYPEYQQYQQRVSRFVPWFPAADAAKKGQ